MYAIVIGVRNVLEPTIVYEPLTVGCYSNGHRKWLYSIHDDISFCH